MKPWRTELIPQKSDLQISHTDNVLTLGSCFAQAIGHRLISHKFKAQVTPFGTVYNPLSIHKIINNMVNNSTIYEDDFVNREEVYFHFDFHSQHAATSANGLRIHLEELINSQRGQLTKATLLIITYGTAFVYRRKSNLQVVANCHKVPASDFTKELLTADEIVQSFDTLVEGLRKLNPSIKIILTVSPVRHIKDTLEMNAVSKSLLRLACHQLSQQPSVAYFPAYELMMDDLRDYRFYKTDRIHPTEEAEDYIWEKFADSFFGDSTKLLLQEWHEITTALKHRPLYPETKSHQRFLTNTLEKLEKISGALPVTSEIAELKSRMSHA